ALPAFGRKIKGYDNADAVLTGVETRTSSPVRIVRDEAYQSPSAKGLYPCGEGAGYAGGIMSAAVDGIRLAEQIIKEYAPVSK
ncbi:MAG: FAD-dependent oxidoreductase, partial [Peptococcaceae bacterium]|nr:FAD-dependent oxidoreductase [Peptococcaceae bacterium]